MKDAWWRRPVRWRSSADQTHYLGDLATNIGVVLAIVLVTWLGWILADPLIAIAVAGCAGHSAFGVRAAEPGSTHGS